MLQQRLAILLVLTALLLPGLSSGLETPRFTLTATPVVPLAGERVTVSVQPENFSATSTTFTWFRNGVKLDASSGLGRSTLTLATDPSQSEIILVKVTAEPETGFEPGEGSIVVATLPPPAGPSGAPVGTLAFSLQASSPNPDPGETVTVRVVSFAFDKNQATYRWHVNGEFQRDASGTGRHRFSFTAGGEGSAADVRVEVTAPSGASGAETVTIAPARVFIYWWAETSVPYWYQGKALPALGSRVTAIALPAAPDGGDLAYRWEFNNAFIPDASGVGRRTFSVGLDFPVEERIGVEIRDGAGTFSKRATLRIGPRAPTVGIYEVRPLRGVVPERRLASFLAPSGEPYDFLAVPFFFPIGRELRYLWTLNGRDITGEFSEPERFTLTSKPATPSSDSLSVAVEDTSRRSRVSSALTIRLR